MIARGREIALIREGLHWFGIDADYDDCDVCDDGSVYYGLTQICPKGTIVTDVMAWDHAERVYGSEGLWLGRRSDGSVEIRRFGSLVEVLS